MERHPRPGWFPKFQTSMNYCSLTGLLSGLLVLSIISYTQLAHSSLLSPFRSSIVLRSPDHLIRLGCGELWVRFLNSYLSRLLPLYFFSFPATIIYQLSHHPLHTWISHFSSFRSLYLSRSSFFITFFVYTFIYKCFLPFPLS
ncbi:hypothetical protein BDV25DRAFT_100014 [Aspergillus avenaceus]|uniref:Uncharacterized protein n=1 Tax=Aspergillus avenaceus TaxID=36643 RepID=A0A5N6TYE8_ASPAV|nr:hypothetical protein BDV25DRAFT_100014 [Aspergillus avenaceus]